MSRKIRDVVSYDILFNLQSNECNIFQLFQVIRYIVLKINFQQRTNIATFVNIKEIKIEIIEPDKH